MHSLYKSSFSVPGKHRDDKSGGTLAAVALTAMSRDRPSFREPEALRRSGVFWGSILLGRSGPTRGHRRCHFGAGRGCVPWASPARPRPPFGGLRTAAL